MKKIKRIFNYLFILLCFTGIISASYLTLGQKEAYDIASADFSSFTQIDNNLPDYLTVNTLSGQDIKDIFLLNAQTKMELSIANLQTIKNESHEENPAYFTQKVEEGESPTEYYYFDFTSSLSLYKDKSNVQIASGEKSTNLLDGASISNFVSQGAFAISEGASFTPKKLNILFDLNTSNADIDVTGNKITLNSEGLYTLCIPTIVYYTNNAGETWTILENKVLNYTFMIFNADTYFTSSGIQNVTFSNNLDRATLISSETYSTYYYYNYSSFDTNTLPSLTYDYKHFKINVHYTNIDDNTFDYFIEYQNGKILTLDASGKQLTDKISIDARLDNGGKAKITFIDLGSYDINFEYLYISETDETTITYELPLDENLTDSQLLNKSQKVFVYGYQALHADYENQNEETNQPKDSELKKFDFNESKYTKTADITSLVNKANGIATKEAIHSSTAFTLTNLERYVTNYLKSSDAKEPVSTNQPPVKFVTNSNLITGNAADTKSAFYKVVEVDNPADPTGPKIKILTATKAFTGFNQNTAGTYVYIMQYQFDQYMSEAGISQASHYHYQIFYFTITNKAPAVTVYSADENETALIESERYNNFTELYTREFTNKNVFIINEADANDFDAKVNITLSAYNYVNDTYYFKDVAITNLQSIDNNLAYGQFTLKFNGTDEETKSGILIKNTASYANANFTITINSKATENPSIQTFTIDTKVIDNVTAYNANETTSSNYILADAIQNSHVTNRPIAISWAEKDSGATTYGYLKYIPFEKNECYSTDKDTQSETIYQLLSSANMLPVTYKINLAEVSEWNEYTNSAKYSINIPATNIRTDNGIYILQVYDQAGNYTFEVFMIDNTSPVFIKTTDGNTLSYELIQNNSNITVPRDDYTNVYIEWSKNKGIYLGTDLNLASYQGYQYSGIKTIDDSEFEETLTTFFNKNTKEVRSITESSFNGHYFISEISNTVYVKDRTKTYSSTVQANYSYQVNFFKNGEAHEGNCKILIRDASNSYNFQDASYAYLYYPSSYISFNITSDLSQFKIYTADGNLDAESYSQIAPLYQKADYSFTTDSVEADGITLNTETGYRKKFSYLPSINTTKELFVSYVPLSSAGTELDEVTVEYYPYQQANENNYFYYTISNTPMLSLTLFKYDSKTSYTAGAEQTNPLNFGQTDEPLAGKYILTRTYRSTADTNNLTKSYDFFSRQIVFYVDTNGLISPLTSVSDGRNTTLENLIGGDIVLNVYSGEGQSNIAVQFPRYNEEGLNSGSFYTKNSFNKKTDPVSVSISSNKLPLSLYIPKYKYTIASIFNMNDEDSNGKDDNNFILEMNKALSNFGHNLEVTKDATGIYTITHDNLVIESGLTEAEAKEYLFNTLSISEYELSGEIEFIGSNGQRKFYSTKLDQTANHYETRNDYLKFYEITSVGGTYLNEVTYFSEPGTYEVTIYQSGNDPLSSMYKCYRFAFKVTKSQPEFDIINQDGYKLEQVDVDGKDYYTNSDSLTIKWTDPSNIYLAKVDKNEILIQGVHVNPTDIKQIEGTNTYYIELTNCISLYKDSGLTISFQYEGYNASYYNKTVKTIYFDTSAPTENLNKLMQNVATSTNDTFSFEMQQKQMRVYLDYNGNELSKEDLDAETQASYISNVDSGRFKYYAFTVKADYFENLIKFVKGASLNKTILSEVYYRQITDITKYTQSDRYSYLNNFNQLSLDSSAPSIANTYYELIETDWAGNKTIYLVYLLAGEDHNAITYLHKGDEEVYVNNNELSENYNIYANPKFALKNLSLNNDPWLYFTFSNNNNGKLTTYKYFKSPFLSENVVYKITYSNGIASYSEESLENVTTINTSSNDKHILTLSNQLTGAEQLCYITVLDSSLVIAKETGGVQNDEAKIGINIPSTQQMQSTSKGYVYPVNITIQTYLGEWKDFASFSQTSFGVWTADDETNSNNEFIAISTASSATINKLLVSAKSIGENTRVKFIITDNFNNEQSIIILTGSNAEEEIKSDSKIYTVYDVDGTSYVSNKALYYTYNPAIYTASIIEGDVYFNVGYHNGVKGKIELLPNTNSYYNGYIKIELRDIDGAATDKPIKTVYLRILNTLPNINKESNNSSNDITNENYGIVFLDKNHKNIGSDNIKADNDANPILLNLYKDGKLYSGPATTITTYSRNVTIQFPNGLYVHNASYTEAYNKVLTFSIFLSSDNGNTWENINGVETLNQYISHRISGIGTYYILITYNDETLLSNTYKMFELTILDSESSYYYITIDGQQATKSNGIKYKDASGQEYEVTYIVSLDYTDKKNSLVIHLNKELNVECTKTTTIYNGNIITGTDDPEVSRGTVVTEIYTFSCSEAKGDFVLIYISPTSNIANTVTYELPSGETISLKNGSNAFIVADKDTEGNFNKLKISFSTYFEIEQNVLIPVVYKIHNNNPVKLDLQPKQSKTSNISYIEIDMAGTYYLLLLDSCTPANSQAFNGATYNGYEFVEITFLSSVPFEVITTNDAGEEIVTAPIQKAVYNSEVKLKLTNTSSYYLPSALITIKATRNGEEIKVTPENNTYSFSQPGYYKVSFSAVSSTNIPIREETFTFTIVNKNESRYAFEFSEYSNYYIENVMKDGKDVTQDLIDFNNFKTIVIGNNVYLSSITLNHLDEKTGDGRYQITINTNNPQYSAIIGESFTFSLWINMAKPPVYVSVSEGSTTTSNITIKINVANFYKTVGDCYIKIGNLRKDYTNENIETYGEVDTITLSGAGTYYIQVYTQGGYLLYSYKVIKNDPLNTFAILAIVLGVIAFSAVVFITIKLRKRQKVK